MEQLLLDHLVHIHVNILCFVCIVYTMYKKYSVTYSVI